MAARRHRGEDSTYRQCAARWGCPPVQTVTGADGKARKVRPEHGRNCRAPWAYSIDQGLVAGRRVRRTVTAKSKRDLMTKVEALKAKTALGVAPTATTVGDWVDYWIDRVSKVRPATRSSYESKIKTYITPAVGHIKLQDLRPEHVEAMADWMRTLTKDRDPKRGRTDPGKLSETTIRQAHMILRSALSAALSRRMVTFNAAAVADAPTAVHNPHAHLGLDDAKSVLRSAVTERELCRLVVALGLGLRQAEALGLRWSEDVLTDGDGSYLLVMESVQRVDGKLTRVEVKSRASKRRVPIPDGMVPIFDAWRASAADPYVFPGPAGGPCDSKADWTAWRESLARAGVPMIPLHGARGSAASLLAEMGVADWQIAEILGHDVRVSRRHYIQGSDAGHRKAIAGLVDQLLPPTSD